METSSRSKLIICFVGIASGIMGIIGGGYFAQFGYGLGLLYIASGLTVIVISGILFFGVNRARPILFGVMLIINLIGLIFLVIYLARELGSIARTGAGPENIGYITTLIGSIALGIAGYILGIVAMLMFVRLDIRREDGSAGIATGKIRVAAVVNPLLQAVAFLGMTAPYASLIKKYGELSVASGSIDEGEFLFLNRYYVVAAVTIVIFFAGYAVAAFFWPKLMLSMDSARVQKHFIPISKNNYFTASRHQSFSDDNERRTSGANAEDDMYALIKYKELLDMGILTPEEFDLKKKQILKW